ncbi:leucine-rich repeats and immunoglobulin-like domains protein 1 [Octopus bimaculoides]|uniref:LRRCT domain-containing protein n=1 Tax=Octopus bimaculoides TaxID=37653 RepID=A0A0L8GJL9_OCTBM|nr:leucine-rich repeats and immunoglobulin-like domains protein 1 [Octopus bimaculoides]XP_052831186.1 leucine-rich repeats and immunoglobulin-like domains protein 1 [Octopus bimaculoides]|eukprot:XP_014780428.1 PREDICTED: leucine-rich repeats and immunoglobulin-like domains protein 1 [Octopus bimaculoides]
MAALMTQIWCTRFGSTCFPFLLLVILSTFTGSESSVSVIFNGTGRDHLLLPTDLPRNTTHIYLDHNHIIEICKMQYPKLIYLNLSHNDIATIETLSFEYTKKLKTLDLSYNKITGTSLTLKTFEKLESLERLILKGNPLYVIKSSVFIVSYFSRLRYEIDFSYCHISVVEPSALANLAKCNALNLSHNNISKLHALSFANIIHLKKLDLSHNSLTEISPSLFSFAHINTLLLNGNHVTKLHCPSLNRIHNLYHLNLAGNHLRSLPCSNFAGSNLRYLDLSNSHLEKLDVDFLSPALKKNLRTLRLNNCPLLQYITAKKSGFTALQSLYLNNNPKLHHIDALAFSLSNKSLKLASIIDIAANRLPKDMLNWSQVLRLSMTNLTCDCTASWMLSANIFNQRNVVLQCAEPLRFKGRSLFTIPPESLVCRTSTKFILTLTLSAVALVVVVLTVIYFRMKKKKKCESCGKRHNGVGYVSVYTHDVEEPSSRIIAPGVNKAFNDAVDV